MKRDSNLRRASASKVTVQRLRKGAEVVLADADAVLLVVRGSCTLRAEGGALRLRAGTVLFRAPAQPQVLDARVARALELLHGEPDKRWTVERLARDVGLSRAAFARRFARVCGCTPLHYLTQVRLALAVDLLESTDQALAELALRVGYTSEFAFSRAFKRQHGVAPGTFRRRQRASFPAVPLLAAA